MSERFKTALSPLRVGPVTIPNRLVRTAHATLFSRDEVNDDHINYHLERARGGIGLSILEGVSIHRSSNFSLHLTDDKAIPQLARLVEAIEPTGMKLFNQLWHGGGIEAAPNGGPSWSVTTLPGRYSRMPPIEMSRRQIAELVRSYGAAAARLARAGLHGAEVLAGNGYLFSQFLSPRLNTRTDAYGGSLGNRIRFLEEVLTDIRASVPSGFALGARMGSSCNKSILTSEDVNAAILHLEGKGLLDFVDISQGDYYFHVERYAGMDRSAGYQIEDAREIGAGVSIPRLIVGRFGTLDDAEQALRAGDGDMINMVRATIADAHLVKKELDGRADEVRPCIACNQGCIGGLFSGRMGCTVNPVVGYEARLGEHLITPSENPQTVVVVGGGPAGMEAARVAALAGHKVTLHEATPDLGGQINIAGRFPKNHGIGDITKWQEREIFRLGVDVHMSSHLEPGEVAAMGADVVILATGAMHMGDGFTQTAAPHLDVDIAPDARIVRSDDLILDASLDLGKSAAVLDDIGHYEAIGVCEFLLERGLDVTCVTRHPVFAPEIEKTGRAQAALRRFYRLGNFRILSDSLVLAINQGSVEVRPVEGIKAETVPADTTVLVTYRKTFGREWIEFADAGQKVFFVGDALSPRNLQTAIREGHLCARSLDTPGLDPLWNNM